MMYSELLNLTGGQATYEQFLNIESVYMAKEDMTKKQAAALWKRRYGKKEEKPLPKYLKEVKDAIRDFKDNREFLDYRIEQEERKIDEKIAEYDPEEWCNQWILERLQREKAEVAYRLCEEFGNDASIHIIYKDGSECIARGAEIVGGLITPKMQNIAYAQYEDGWMEYDTLTGILVDNDTDFFGDLSTDEGIETRENYYNMIEIKYGTEWGKKHSA